ncbi:biotin/lipoyl-binding protein [Sansalvadorimonas verongulae]|nr:biotin/lipoyl-binding protein [Sansalvadorimonas verongulae]
MSVSLFSQQWYRVAELQVHLRRHADVHRHTYREQVWFVLQDHATGQFHRFTPEAWHIIALMDGERSLQTIWEQASMELGDAMPSQDEVIDLVSRLFNANLLHSDSVPDIELLNQRYRNQKRKRQLQKVKSPLAIRIPLMDPERFLRRTEPFVRPLISRWGMLFWLGVVVAGIVLAGLHWEVLTKNVSDRILSLENVLLIALIYPFVKTIHELGHAYIVKRWGGEVHEIGIMLLVFFPVPYVDASAASAFHSKYQRMLTGAAGILVESLIAALAMIVWTLVEPGAVRAIAFNTMLVAGVSTLLFNGNPLLRFDAYYVLADWLEIPNLATRGNQYLGYLVKRYILNIPNQESQVTTRKEGLWLAGYVTVSYVYRLFIMVAIALFIAGQYFFIGTLLAIWLMVMTLVMPLMKIIKKAMGEPSIEEHSSRLWGLVTGVVVTVVAAFGMIPFPLSTVAEGVILPPEQSMVRVRTGGFVQQLAIGSGDTVEEGQLLAQLADPELVAQQAVLEANYQEALVQYQASVDDRTAAELNREVVRFRKEELENKKQKTQRMTVNSPQTGVFYLDAGDSLNGRFLPRGELLGYVIADNTALTVMVPEDAIELVRNNTRAVEARFVSARDVSLSAEVVRIAPASTRQLPSRILTLAGGGKIASNPDESEGVHSFGRYFQLELALDDKSSTRLNERVYVRFSHDPEPLVFRWVRDLRRLFLRQLDV